MQKVLWSDTADFQRACAEDGAVELRSAPLLRCKCPPAANDLNDVAIAANKPLLFSARRQGSRRRKPTSVLALGLTAAVCLVASVVRAAPPARGAVVASIAADRMQDSTTLYWSGRKLFQQGKY